MTSSWWLVAWGTKPLPKPILTTKKFVPVISFYLSPVCWFYHFRVIMSVIVNFIILVLSWVLLSILSFFVSSGVLLILLSFMSSYCNGKTQFWCLERITLHCTSMGLWCFGGLWVGFRDTSGNSYPTYMFTPCFVCFNCMFNHFIFYVSVF